MGWGPTLHFKQVPRQCWSTKHEDLEPVGRRQGWVPASLLGNRTHTGFGVGLGSWVWVPQASCVPLTGLTMVTASGTSKANISRASVALRSANTQLRPSPWSRAAWPAWTPTPSCCLSWAPCPLSTPESGPHPPSPPLDGHSSAGAPVICCSQPIFSSPSPSHIPARGPGGLTAPLSQSWFLPGRVTSGLATPLSPSSAEV